MNENTSTGSITGTEGEMRECVENEENFAGGVNTLRCTTATTTTTTVIPTQTTTNNVLDTHKQTSTSGELSGRSTTKPTSKHPSTTSTSCGGISEQYSSYVKDNLDIVGQKCSEFHACTVELYKSENLHRILAGDNIQLRNICGLLYQNAYGSYRILDNQCLTQERESIKEILGDEELSTLLEGSSPGEDSWGNLKTCLDNTPGDNTYLDKLCRLKGNSTLPLCNSTDVQTTTEKFFNDKLRQHHCICNTFTDSSGKSLPLGPLIGGICGGSLTLLLIVIIVVLYVRQRKLKRRLTTESKRSGQTTSPTDETCTYQRIHDHSQVPQTPTSRLADQKPPLPERSIPSILPTTTSHNDYDYLELLPDVACVYYKKQLPQHPATVGVQPPPQDRPYVLAKHVAPSPASDRKTRATEGPDRSLEEATYFDKIDIKSVTETSPDGGYTPLGLTPTLVVRHQSTDSEEGESGNPQYFELEPS